MTDGAKKELPSLVEDCLLKEYDNVGEKILSKSKLLQYIDKKTGSVGSSPKSRANLANLTAVYVVVEDYIKIQKMDQIIRHIKEHNSVIFRKGKGNFQAVKKSKIMP